MRQALLGLTVLVGMGVADCAAAQTLDTQTVQATFLGNEIPYDFNRGANVSVLERDRPEYEAVGIAVGGFDLFPKVETGIGYLDNVFATKTNKQSDGYFILDPSLTLRSDWSRHYLAFTTGAQLREFFNQSTENEEDAYAQVDGRLDVNSDNMVYGGAYVRKAYEERSSGGYPVGAAAPVEYVQSGGYLRAQHEGGRFKLTAAQGVDHFSFDSVPALAGGDIYQGDRDRTVLRTSGRAEYGVTPDTAVLGQLTYTRTGYDRDLADGRPNRDSDEYKILGGASFDINALIRGQVVMGYVTREYDSGIYNELSGFAADALVQYFPTQLTTVSLSGRRLIEDSFFLTSGGYFNNGVNLRVDHELLYNLILSGQVDYERDEFDGVDRHDDIVSLGATARYLISNEVGVGAAVSYTNRDSSGSLSGIVFDETRFTLTLALQR